MAKHKRREQEPINNQNNTNNNNNNNPFGIDPAQLLGLLGGNFNMSNMGNMLASMNTNGFNLGDLEPLAKMAGLNLENGFPQGNNNMMNNLMNLNKNMNSNMNMNGNYNMNPNFNNNNMNSNSNSKMNMNKKNAKETNMKNDHSNDPNLNFLMSLREYIHPDRVKLIDRMIELYNSGAFKDI